MGLSGLADPDENRTTTLSYEAWLHSVDKQ
jgi:hypothetical protein